MGLKVNPVLLLHSVFKDIFKRYSSSQNNFRSILLSVLGINILGYERALNGLLTQLAKFARCLKFKSWHVTVLGQYSKK